MPSRFIDGVLSPQYRILRSSLAKCNLAPAPGKCTVPVEILEEIVLCMLEERHIFFAIANFSLASYQFRQVAFRNYFRQFRATTKTMWSKIIQISGVFDWVRTLESDSMIVFSQLHDLSCFKHLQNVAIRMPDEGLSTQKTFIKYLFKNLPSALLHFKLSFLPRIDTTLLTSIAAKLSDLRTLELTCTERLIDDCCWDCLEEVSTCTIHSPLPDIYCNAEDLSYAFGASLSPLAKLEHLHLGIFLSELDIFYFHLYNCRSSIVETAIGPTIVGTSSGGPDTCPKCHVAFAAGVRGTELYASASVARFLPSLKTVSWSSYFAEDNPGDDRDALTTTAWILRKDGKVKVRRAAWN